MPQGGEITIVNRVRDAVVEISFSDTGQGIPPEVAGNIFQPYFTTRKRAPPGFGHLSEHYPGARRLHFGRQQPGQGSTFTIRCPWKKAPPVNN